MGIPSPFIGAVASPALGRSKPGTPDLPLLETFDEFKGNEVFELCPAQYDVISPEKARVLASWEDAREEVPEAGALPVQDDAVEAAEAQPAPERTYTVPAWPSHWPDYLGEVIEFNTFLELPELEGDVREPARRRAGSDWTGMRELEKGSVDVLVEDLRKPLPPAASWPGAEGAGGAGAPEDASRGQHWCWMVPCEANGGWTMMYNGACQDGSQGWPQGNEDAPRLPPLPAAEQAYRPKWVYGSSWPFNCAPTTLILENLPRDITQAEFLAVLDASGFGGCYDFVFLPTSLRSGRSHGNAIVNLTRHSYGQALAARVQGFADWGPSKDGSRCQAKWSLPLQGLAEHVENYRNDPVMHESVPHAFRPTIFADGWQVPFPPPTRPLRAPRLGIH
mmetsp:Transcript_52254/g.162166  ORF Transcript_52254/g.162166 Transcript_52254/m.162166 type:complete len:392 (+) Transcript_52254:120-1295(+)